MKQIAFILVGLFPLVSMAQDDLASKVADIAALSVRNTDGLESLRDRVAGLEGKVPSILSRLDMLEGRVFEVPSVTPPMLYKPITAFPPITSVVQRAAPTIVKQVVRQKVGRTVRAPLRSFLARVFIRRKLSNVTIANRSWSWPGDLSTHLIGPPHYLAPSYVMGLSQAERVSIHDSLHGGY